MTRTLNFALCALAALIVAASTLPGTFSADAVWMLYQAQTSVLDDQHAPLYTALFGKVTNVYAGPGELVLINIVSYFLCIFYLVEIIRPRSIALSYLALALSVAPLAIYELHYVQKDCLIRNSLLAAVICTYWWLKKRQLGVLLAGLLFLSFAIAGRVTGYIAIVPIAMYVSSVMFPRPVLQCISVATAGTLAFFLLLYSSLNFFNYQIMDAEKNSLDVQFGKWVQCVDIFAMNLGADNFSQLENRKYRYAIDHYRKVRHQDYVFSAIEYCEKMTASTGKTKTELWLENIADYKIEYIQHHLNTYWRYWNGAEKSPLGHTKAQMFEYSPLLALVVSKMQLSKDGPSLEYEPRFPRLRSAYFQYQELILKTFPSTIFLFVFGLICSSVFCYQYLILKEIPSFFAFAGFTAMVFSLPMLVFTNIVEPRYMFVTESLLLLAIPFALYELPYFKSDRRI